MIKLLNVSISLSPSFSSTPASPRSKIQHLFLRKIILIFKHPRCNHLRTRKRPRAFFPRREYRPGIDRRSQLLCSAGDDASSKARRSYAHIVLRLQSHAEYILRQWTPVDVSLGLSSSSLRIVQGKLRQLSVNDECLRGG